MGLRIYMSWKVSQFVSRVFTIHISSFEDLYNNAKTKNRMKKLGICRIAKIVHQAISPPINASIPCISIDAIRGVLDLSLCIYYCACWQGLELGTDVENTTYKTAP